MAKFTIHANGKTLDYEELEQLLGAIYTLLQLGEKFVVTVAKTATTAIDAIARLFQKHNIQLKLTIDSDPAAADYVFNALAGAAIGGVIGAAGGAALGVGLRIAGAAIPGLQPFVIGGTIAGVVVGTVGGAVVTHWGLKARFVPGPAEQVELSLVPLAA